MTEIKLHPQTPEQIQENREMLSCLLGNVEKICDIASDEVFIANFFGMSKTDFTFLWYDIMDLREKIEGNECDIRVTKKDDEKAHLEVTGDTSFIEFLRIENNNDILRINVKNPTGSDTKWMPYNRGNYNKRNIITLYTGKEHCQLFVINYLDLNCYESEIADGVNQWIFMKERL